MSTSPLLRNDNPYLRQTEWKARPSRQDPAWRYRPEPELLLAQDRWDAAETHRRQVETMQKEIDGRLATKAREEARAKQERDDAVIDGELLRRYIAGGGSEHAFITNRAQIRSDFALEVAVGRAKPIASDLEQLKQELRALKATRNLGAPDRA